MYKKIKKIFILFLLFILIAPSTKVLAKTPTAEMNMTSSEMRKIEQLIKTKVVGGREVNGKKSFALDENITRAEFAKIIVESLNLNKNEYRYLDIDFSDVPKTHWAYNYIAIITRLNNPNNKQYIMQGYPNNTFQPDSPITTAEVATILVRLKKDNLKLSEIFANEYPKNYLTWANEERIFRGTSDQLIKNYNNYIKRKDAFVMFFNTYYEEDF